MREAGVSESTIELFRKYQQTDGTLGGVATLAGLDSKALRRNKVFNSSLTLRIV
jgi:hypothetical protein